MNFLYNYMATALCVSFLTVSVSARASAQTAGKTEGAIVGTVTDPSHAAVPGVKVTLAGVEVMGARSVTSDENGIYRFPALAPGDYKLTYELAGFTTQTREGVHISLGFTATVNAEMAVGGETQTVTVTAETSAIDLQANTVTTNFEDQQLRNLPGSRDLWAVLSQTPAVAETKMDVGGSDALTQQPYTVYGLGSSGGVGGGGINRGEVEGMMVNEGAGGGGSDMFYVDYGAMQTISVNAASNTAEMPQPGVLSQLFVKTGGNEFHGDAYFDYENSAMEGHNIDASQMAALTSGGVQPTAAVPLTDTNRLQLFRDFSADAGGYLKKNKLWWFAAYRYTTTEQNYPTLNEPQRSWSPNYTVKVTYNITDRQKLVGFYTHSNKLQPDYLNALVISGGRQAGALESASTTWSSHYPVYVANAQYTFVITPKLVLEARAGTYYSGWTRNGKSNLPRIEDVTTNFVSGGLQNTASERRRPQANGSVSYIHSGWLGTHNLKFGSEYMRDTNFTPWGGLGLPGDLAPSVPCPSVIPNAILGSTCQVVSTLSNGSPLNAYFYANPGYVVRNGNSTFGFYGNDTWQISRRLTLNVGLRFDRQNIFSLQDTGPNGQTFPAANYIAFHNFGPRGGISYDLTGHGSSVVKLAFGHYFNYPAADYGAGLNPDNSGGWYYAYRWTPAADQLAGRGGDTAGNYYHAGDTLGALQAFQGGAATTAFPSNLKLANTYQASAYFEQQAGSFTLRTGFVWNALRDIAGTVNVNRPLSAFTVPKTLYVPGPDNVASASSPAVTVWDLAPGTPSAALNVFKNLPENDHYYNWEFTALKRTGSRWTLMGSFNYTWNYVRNFSNGFGTGSSFTPNQLINTAGCANAAPCINNGMAQYYNWQGKLSSTVRLPWLVNMTPIFRLQSGIPFGRYFNTSGIKAPAGLEPSLTVNGNVLAEPFGAERTGTMVLFDVRTEKQFRFGERFVTSGFVDLYNIFNANTNQAVTAASGASFLTPSSITPPRVARIGVKFQF
jgi:outer membrane receptor protein involved in Fe transport